MNRPNVRHFLVILLCTAFSISVRADKKVTYRKTQEVNFDTTDVSGTIRKPEGMYLVQKRNVDFVPLYKVRESFDRNIKESVEYMR